MESCNAKISSRQPDLPTLICSAKSLVQKKEGEKKKRVCPVIEQFLFSLSLSPSLHPVFYFLPPQPLCLLALSIDYLPVYVRGYLASCVGFFSSSHLCLCLQVCVGVCVRERETSGSLFFVLVMQHGPCTLAGKRQGLGDRWPPSPSQAGEIAPSQPPEWMASQPVSLK